MKTIEKNTVLGIMFLVLFATFSNAIMAASTYDSTYDNAYVKTTLLNQDPDPAEPGKYVEMRWTVVKFGNNKLDNITFKIEPKYPFSMYEGDTNVKTISSWLGVGDEDSYYTLFFKMKVNEDAVEGTYDLDLLTSTVSGSWAKKTYTVRVGEKNIPELGIGLLKTEPSKLMPDTNENVLNIEVMNNGDGTSEGIIAELDLPEGFENSFGYSNRVNLGNIPAHSSKYAKVYLDVNKNVKQGIYETKLHIRYNEEDETETRIVEIPVNIEVMSKPSFTIESIDFGKENILPGDSVEMKLKVKNNIDKKVESVSVRAFKDSTQPIDFDEKSDFVGTLDPSESGDAVIQFSVKKDAEPKKYILDLEIRSVYNDQVFIQTEKVAVEVSAKKEGFDQNIITYGLVAVIFVLLAIIIFMRKKR